ncbi:hypothetical protein M5E87_08045 [Flavonifractor plautii]|nr:hypothetical protein M5E87_08045 [Flavonifractor plautii]
MNQLGKFNGVLLVSDFDDTLYGEDMRITRENVEALTYFTREGAPSPWPPAAPAPTSPPRQPHTHQRAGDSVQRLRPVRLPDRGDDLRDLSARPGAGGSPADGPGHSHHRL